ncbi:MAG: hypothetical protein JWR61_3978 [Ferruginibacter sp.]|nr:hypothetical protein [Ferruginibacter sp.]
MKAFFLFMTLNFYNSVVCKSGTGGASNINNRWLRIAYTTKSTFKMHC